MTTAEVPVFLTNRPIISEVFIFPKQPPQTIEDAEKELERLRDNN
ncbi:hypothetical protein PYCH_16490 [Pyrococcus yayanosii CH1]|uniref:Uncharacterized protein n=1 Tax=Pyrococcus yayanosii (strain CH1 / JCM 16557) TaxID=529709 RepID=F8AH85_PYRYC|nr:hypothetical protein PYCH_16490 [Pyrococcus yayanosii CH1]